MAKRYHQSKIDRMDESHGMKKRMSDGEYAGYSGRRTQEMEDGGMIREDHNATSNLPQEVMIKSYPRSYSYLPEDLDDTIRGVDKQIGLDDSKRREHFMPKKV